MNDLSRRSRELEGKVAIVTGAGRGIGHGIAIALAQAGADVTLVDRDPQTVDVSAQEINSSGGRASAQVCNVGDRSEVASVIDTVTRRHQTIDILVNNAQALRAGVALQDCTPADLALTLDSGLWGSFHFMQLCYPHLAGHDSSIINIGSSAGTHGQTGLGPYAAAKEAIRGLSKVAALEWGKDGITVNVVCPSVMTEPAKAWAAANPRALADILAKRAIPRDGDAVDDIGRTVVFLAGPGARFMTGQTLMVNGGGSLAP